MNPEQCLQELEILRLEAGKFLYEYTAPFKMVIGTAQRKRR
jgi:hypothetical protein